MSAPTELSLLVSLRRVVGLSIVAGTLKEVLMPGRVWLNYSTGAAGGATVADWFRFPLLLPALLLVFLVLDLVAKQPGLPARLAERAGAHAQDFSHQACTRRSGRS